MLIIYKHCSCSCPEHTLPMSTVSFSNNPRWHVPSMHCAHCLERQNAAKAPLHRAHRKLCGHSRLAPLAVLPSPVPLSEPAAKTGYPQKRSPIQVEVLRHCFHRTSFPSGGCSPLADQGRHRGTAAPATQTFCPTAGGPGFSPRVLELATHRCCSFVAEKVPAATPPNMCACMESRCAQCPPQHRGTDPGLCSEATIAPTHPQTH